MDLSDIFMALGIFVTVFFIMVMIIAPSDKKMENWTKYSIECKDNGGYPLYSDKQFYCLTSSSILKLKGVEDHD